MKKLNLLRAATSVVLSYCCTLAFALDPLSYAKALGQCRQTYTG